MKTILVCMVTAVWLVQTGCQNERMSDFEEFEVHIMRDEATGKRYAVKHHIGNTYSVYPVKEPS